jgi:hypothetical protein
MPGLLANAQLAAQDRLNAPCMGPSWFEFGFHFLEALGQITRGSEDHFFAALS